MKHTCNRLLRLGGACLALILVLLSCAPARAQYTENVMYDFTGTPDGAEPYYGSLAFDAQGNAYGTTLINGAHGSGIVYKLSPPSSGNGPWIETLLYNFCSQPGCADGSSPYNGVILDSQGNLYGTTSGGGAGSSLGTVYELSPMPGGGCPSGSNTGNGWCETVIYAFCSAGDCSTGQSPQSVLIFDSAGNLYGTTGGGSNGGVVFELSPPDGGTGPWTETVISTICGSGCSGGGLTFGAAGNLYGTTGVDGAYGHGVVFELSPNPSGGICHNGGSNVNGWCQLVLYNFCAASHCADGAGPLNNQLVFDSNGNMYGTTVIGGTGPGPGGFGSGSVFELSPAPAGGCPSGSYTGNGWCDTILHSFGNSGDGATPSAGVIRDSAGNLYGTTIYGGAQTFGTVYELSPSSGGAWTENVILNFSGLAGGDGPNAGVTFGPNGYLYGTAYTGGPPIKGLAFELVPPPAPTVSISSSLNPSGYGQSLTFTATVTANPGSNGPLSGTVQFQIDGTAFGSAVSLSGGVALSDSIATLTTGQHTVTAAYSGDLYNGPASGTYTQAVQQVGDTVSVALTNGTNPSAYGLPLTFTATIAGANGQLKKRSRGAHPQDVTGSVTWSDNTGCGVTSVTAGVATCTTSSLPVGASTITANYSGDSNHSPGSGSLGETVTQQTPAVAITGFNPASQTYGVATAITVTATLTWSGNGSAPSGSLKLSSTMGGSFAGSPSCSVSGTALTCTQTFNPLAKDPIGSYTFSASYAGDANYTSAASTQTNNFAVTQQTPNVAITLTPVSEAYGALSPVTVTGTLSWTGTGLAPTAPAGTKVLGFTASGAGSFWNGHLLGDSQPRTLQGDIHSFSPGCGWHVHHKGHLLR